jgi:hypothetical protein
MGIFDAGIGFLERIRVSALIPRLDIAVEGTARLCTDEHIPIYVAGAPDPPPGPLHIDVSLDMWNKRHRRVAVLEQRHARAAGQDLRDGTTLGTGSFHRVDFGTRRAEDPLLLQPVAFHAGRTPRRSRW